MSESLHIFYSNQGSCAGKKFAELYIRCSKCNNPNYSECMESNDGVISIMKALGVMNAKGEVLMSTAEWHKVHLMLKSIFSQKNPFLHLHVINANQVMCVIIRRFWKI